MPEQSTWTVYFLIVSDIFTLIAAYQWIFFLPSSPFVVLVMFAMSSGYHNNSAPCQASICFATNCYSALWRPLAIDRDGYFFMMLIVHLCHWPLLQLAEKEIARSDEKAASCLQNWPVICYVCIEPRTPGRTPGQLGSKLLVSRLAKLQAKLVILRTEHIAQRGPGKNCFEHK